MSLSSHLQDKSSPVRKFLRSQFSETTSFLRDDRKRVRNAGPTVRPDAEYQGQDIPYPWTTIGTAIDYRIRYYFAATPCNELVAYLGAMNLMEPPAYLLSYLVELMPKSRRLLESVKDFPESIQSEFPRAIQAGFRQRHSSIEFFDKKTREWLGTYLKDDTIQDGKGRALAAAWMPGLITSSEVTRDTILSMGERLMKEGIGEGEDDVLLEGVCKDFFESLDVLTCRCDPVSRRLTESEEDELNRYCIILALLEEVYRGGLSSNSPLLPILVEEHASVVDLLDIPAAHWISDMRNLSWTFYDRFSSMLSLPYCLNPTFDGSNGVGGADADMVIDNTLIDIKTTIRPEIKSDWIWQLLGYVLLDYSDKHEISGIGVYMARQGIFLKWDLDEVITGLCSGGLYSIEELRSEFKEIVERRGLL